jgi:hypothetical protein
VQLNGVPYIVNEGAGERNESKFLPRYFNIPFRSCFTKSNSCLDTFWITVYYILIKTTRSSLKEQKNTRPTTKTMSKEAVLGELCIFGTVVLEDLGFLMNFVKALFSSRRLIRTWKFIAFSHFFSKIHICGNLISREQTGI